MAILQNTTVSGSLVITGDLTARQFILSSSVTFYTESFASGSTRFGDSMDDTMTVTGSLRVTGSGTFAGALSSTNGTFIVNDTATNSVLDILTLTHTTTGTGASGLGAGILFRTERPSGGITLSRGAIYGVSGADADDDGDLTFYTLTDTGGSGFSEKMRITSGGNVGIGTSSPSKKLDIFDNNAGGSDDIVRAYQDLLTNHAFYRSQRNGGANMLIGATRNNVDGNISANISILWNVSNNDMAFGTNNTERMRITSGGNVGIGITNPSAGLEVVTNGAALNAIRSTTTQAFNAGPETSIVFRYRHNTAGDYTTGALINVAKDNTTDGNQSGNLQFWTNNAGTVAERMRITSAGRVGIGTNSPGFDVTIGSNAAQKVLAVGALHLVDAYIDNAVYGCRILGTDNGVDGTNMQFAMRNTPSGGFSTRMTITTTGNIGAPSGTNIYNASDRRLKRNITPLSDALSKVLNLNPVMFNWIQGYEPTEEDKDMLGFIAQDMQEVVPEAVESFAGGDPLKIGDLEVTDPLRVNEKFIIPVLVKAIQELSAKVTALETT